MSMYRPSAVMRLQVRIDEGRTSAELLSKLEPPKGHDASAIQASPEAASGSRGAELAVAAQQVSTLNKLSLATGGEDPALARELERALAKKRDLAPVPGRADPLALRSGQNNDGLSITIGALPIVSCEVERSSFRTGDKARFTLNYWDAPFDPRIMRAAGIEIVIGVVTPEEHDAGMHGMTRADGSRHSTVQDAPGVRRETRFIGFVSKWEFDFTDEGAIVHGEAEDLIGLLRDTPLPADLEMPHDLPIEQGIGSLLDAFPATRGIHVQFGDDTTDGPVPGTAAARRKKIVKKGKKRVRRNAENTNLWDHITDVCVGTGLIPVVDGLVIRIEYARTLFGKKPDVPRMVWGQNLKKLSFSRTMSGFKNPTVEVRSYNIDKRRTYAARYPDPKGFGLAVIGERDFPKVPKTAGRVTPSGKPDEPIRVVAVYDVRPQILPEIARGIYEETKRQEIEGSFATHDPASFGEDFEAADLLDLRAGDPIAIEIDTKEGQGETADAVTRLHSMDPAERVAQLVASGFQRRVAVAYAALLDQSQLQTVYRVSTTRLSFDHDDGLTVDVDFCNFITVREDPKTRDSIREDASPGAKSRARGAAGSAGARLKDASAARRTADARARAGQGAPATPAERAAESAAAGVADQAYSGSFDDELMSRGD